MFNARTLIIILHELGRQGGENNEFECDQRLVGSSCFGADFNVRGSSLWTD
jgi:hypothetical protein